MALTLITLCAFVVSFFANSVLTRWWAVRQDLGVFMMMMMIILETIAEWTAYRYLIKW